MNWLEAAARSFDPRGFRTPGELAKHLNPKTVQTPALDLIDGDLMELSDTPGGRLIVSMPPQQGKSTRISQVFPVWSLMQNPDRPIIVASYGEQLAERNGENIRNLIDWNDLPIKVAAGSSSKKRWRLEGHEGGVLSVGVGSGMTGWAAQMLIIDDPIKDWREANSKVYRDRVWEWWLSVAQTRLAPGAPVALVLTRWHEDDLAGRLKNAPDGDRWKVRNIPAVADHDPARGGTDPLGRKPGEYLQSARVVEDRARGTERPMTKQETESYWEQIRVGVGTSTWNALYQGRPRPAEGGLFKRDQWRYYDRDLSLLRDDGSRWVVSEDFQIVQSWDLAFKATDSTDYVVGQVWMRLGARAYLLDQVRGRWDFPETCRQIVGLSAKWPQAALKLVEDKANGPAVIATLSSTIPGLVPEQVSDSKVARANAVTPFVEAGNVYLPAPTLAPWVTDLVEEAAAFPKGAHDDQVDALSQGLNRLLVSPLIPADASHQTSEWSDYEALGYYATPY